MILRKHRGTRQGVSRDPTNVLVALKISVLLLAVQGLLEQDPLTLLKLEEGQKIYIAHVGRTPALGGAEVAPGRYKAVFDKFIPFAQESGVDHWQFVTAEEDPAEQQPQRKTHAGTERREQRRQCREDVNQNARD